MATPYEPPNPLRPYYIPPQSGPSPDITSNATSSTLPKGTASKPSFHLPDLDYSDYIPEASPSATETIKNLTDKAIWKYTSVLIAQPFEVAKTILQVYVASDEVPSTTASPAPSTPSYSRASSYRNRVVEEEDSSDDEPNYFSSTAPYSETTPPRGRRGRPTRREAEGHGQSSPQPSSPNTIILKNTHSLLDALSALSSNSGALSMWKGTNTTFVYSVLARTMETFLRSLIAAIFALPDTDLPSVSTSGIPTPDILSTAFPFATLLVTTAASTITSIILAPVDAARTRLILTPPTQSSQSLLSILRSLPTPYLIPSHLIPITTLHSLIPSLFSSSTPLLMKTYLNLDPIMTPTSWSIASFVSSSLELVFRFPLETILRRAQIATFTSPAIRARAVGAKSSYSSTNPPPKCQTVVPVQQNYRGIIPTAWSIIHEEGYTTSPATPKELASAAMGKDDAKRGNRKGQGVAGLYRGWRVGMWGLIGIWGAGWMGGMAAGGPTGTGEVGGGSHGGKF